MKTRDQILESADQLFYQQGYEHTSFSDIAKAVRISRGNFYHHFKTKDEILHAVIDLRANNTRAMLEEWESGHEDPMARIRCYLQILLTNGSNISLYGCPVGTLSSELAKLDHASQGDAVGIFTLFREWLGKQFSLLGCGSDADALAMHVLAWSQGVATLVNAFPDEAFVLREVNHMCAWLQARVSDPGKAGL